MRADHGGTMETQDQRPDYGAACQGQGPGPRSGPWGQARGRDQEPSPWGRGPRARPWVQGPRARSQWRDHAARPWEGAMRPGPLVNQATREANNSWYCALQGMTKETKSGMKKCPNKQARSKWVPKPKCAQTSVLISFQTTGQGQAMGLLEPFRTIWEKHERKKRKSYRARPGSQICWAVARFIVISSILLFF